ncbi:hypothetical protein QQF64_007892 [Cirrhinus molitorella]|uniref:CCHC-type domain-containing protein n=1 Tax=Cirrhinus molitorella TaxID=172907 RepID=A0ABR3M640_9TELE
MAFYDDSIGLEAFLQQTTRITQRLAACQPQNPAPQSTSVAARPPVPEPMQVDSNRLTQTERTRRLSSGLCLYCGNPGHIIRHCPVRPPRPVVSTIRTEINTTSLTLLPVTLHTAELSLSVSALVDSGSSGNFISSDCLKQLQLRSQRHSTTYSVSTIQGKPLGRGRIRHRSPYITLQVGLFHKEDIQFLVLEGSTVNIILGRPWLQLHHPELRWDPCDVSRWSEHCQQHCLSKLPLPCCVPISLASTQLIGLRALDIRAADGPSRSSNLATGGPVWTVIPSGYHPQTNGQTERKIQELGRYLRSYCAEDQHSWSRFLPWAEQIRGESWREARVNAILAGE